MNQQMRFITFTYASRKGLANNVQMNRFARAFAAHTHSWEVLDGSL